MASASQSASIQGVSYRDASAFLGASVPLSGGRDVAIPVSAHWDSVSSGLHFSCRGDASCRGAEAAPDTRDGAKAVDSPSGGTWEDRRDLEGDLLDPWFRY